MTKQNSNENKLTAEQQKKMDEWSAFMKNLEDNAEQPATNGELLQVINAVADDIRSVASVAEQALTNTQALHQMITPIVQVFAGNGNTNRTRGGIIVP